MMLSVYNFIIIHRWYTSENNVPRTHINGAYDKFVLSFIQRKIDLVITSVVVVLNIFTEALKIKKTH